MEQKTALVFGAGGFIGSHLVRRLKTEGYRVTGVDLKKPEFSESPADEFLINDLRNNEVCRFLFSDRSYGECYQLAANMGGAGFIFSGENDADIMRDSAQINLNVARNITQGTKLFYSSSACVYKENPDDPSCSEESAYPSEPDSNYGWEKLFSERLYAAHAVNFNAAVKTARFHNIFGPEGCFTGGREKAPAALCRKVAEAKEGSEIEIWGDGTQLRSFLYIDECIEGIRRLMQSDFTGPVNIGADRIITIGNLADVIIRISGKNLKIRYVDGPTGVHGRNSDNALIKKKLGWEPSNNLYDGLVTTYKWIEGRVKR